MEAAGTEETGEVGAIVSLTSTRGRVAKGAGFSDAEDSSERAATLEGVTGLGTGTVWITVFAVTGFTGTGFGTIV